MTNMGRVEAQQALGYLQHLQGCEIDQTEFCTCGLKECRGQLNSYVLDLEFALMRIAGHFEGCDIRGDKSANAIVRWACTALGWNTTVDEFNQVKLIKGKA